MIKRHEKQVEFINKVKELGKVLETQIKEDEKLTKEAKNQLVLDQKRVLAEKVKKAKKSTLRKD